MTYRAVEELYCSPAVKRSIWSALKIVSEIKKVQGYSPKKIFVETTREKPDGARKGQRTVSRKQRLLDVYRKNLRNEKELIKKLRKQRIQSSTATKTNCFSISRKWEKTLIRVKNRIRRFVQDRNL